MGSKTLDTNGLAAVLDDLIQGIRKQRALDRQPKFLPVRLLDLRPRPPVHGQRFRGSRSDVDNSLLPALAVEPDQALPQVDHVVGLRVIGRVAHPADLRAPGPGINHEQHEGMVPDALERLVLGEGVDKPVEIVLGEDWHRGLDQDGRVDIDHRVRGNRVCPFFEPREESV